MTLEVASWSFDITMDGDVQSTFELAIIELELIKFN